jgi:hypothetical protein
MDCVGLVGPFTVKKPLKSNSLLALTIIDPVNVWSEILKATNKMAAFIKFFFITPGWRNNVSASSIFFFDNQGQIQTRVQINM